jgi:hypothetical protein
VILGWIRPATAFDQDLIRNGQLFQIEMDIFMTYQVQVLCPLVHSCISTSPCMPR